MSGPRWAAITLALSGAAAVATPTYLVEWVSRTGDATQRVTLFTDGVLVRKSTADGKTEMKKRKLSPTEFDSYAAIFRAAESEQAAGVFDSGMSGEKLSHSVITVTREDASTWNLAFDSFAAVTPEAQRIKAALEDLRDSFGKATSSTGDFPPEKLAPGAILRRRDGVEFRVIHYDDHAGIVELRGLNEPYSQFFKVENLPLTFYPP